MTAYRIYTKPKGKAQAKQRLVATAYSSADAEQKAGFLALKGLWVTITKAETSEPSRWD